MKKIESLVLVGSCLAFLVFIGTSYYFLCSILNSSVNLSNELQLDSKNRYLFSIEKGTNLKRVNDELSRKKILNKSPRSTDYFRLRSRCVLTIKRSTNAKKSVFGTKLVGTGRNQEISMPIDAPRSGDLENRGFGQNFPKIQ